MRRTLTAAVATTALTIGLMAPAAARPEMAGPPAVEGSIVDTAVALNDGDFAGTFDELIFAVTELGLADTLDTKRKFTVFAPTDGAFAALASGLGIVDANGDGLVADDIVGATSAEYVTDVLLYHVAPGERFASDVIEGSQVNTLLRSQNIDVSIDTSGDEPVVLLDEAPVLLADVATSNGVIHVIGGVLVPYLPS